MLRTLCVVNQCLPLGGTGIGHNSRQRSMSAILSHGWEVDTNLMLQVKHGDQASLEVLLNKHRKRLIHWLHRMVQDRAVAEELAQEVFLRVYLSREKYEPTAK